MTQPVNIGIFQKGRAIVKGMMSDMGLTEKFDKANLLGDNGGEGLRGPVSQKTHKMCEIP